LTRCGHKAGREGWVSINIWVMLHISNGTGSKGCALIVLIRLFRGRHGVQNTNIRIDCQIIFIGLNTEQGLDGRVIKKLSSGLKTGCVGSAETP